jgi:hypothetical protein
MKVYSVLRSEPYQGYDLLVVFGSRQECLDYIEKQEGYIKSQFNYGVVESELGQEIDFWEVDWID